MSEEAINLPMPGVISKAAIEANHKWMPELQIAHVWDPESRYGGWYSGATGRWTTTGPWLDFESFTRYVGSIFDNDTRTIQ
ncbi:MAG: hypothetical protein NXH85_18595 [Pseudomonadaceae bacterium]|nr:hypothetical protein [Pseudomonadaceae bacterium]